MQSLSAMFRLGSRARIHLASAVFVIALSGTARAQSFSDDFEAPTFDSFWTLVQQNGSISLSMDTSQSGFQSAKLTGAGGGQVNVWLVHTFPQRTPGTLSVWFYDSGPGLYAGLYASDSQSGDGFSVNVTDWNPSTYVWYGGQMSATATSVPRTVGWHKIELQITATGFNALLDENVVGSLPGSFGFDDIKLLVSGPGQAGTFYFDDFRFIAPLTIPLTKDDCKDGGWRHLVRSDGTSFKNQGACVSYANIGT
jgi:hypothetical protein